MEPINRNSQIQCILDTYAQSHIGRQRRTLCAEALQALKQAKPARRKVSLDWWDSLDTELVQELFQTLVQLYENKDARTYSVVLQAWLLYHEIRWPRGVFTPDIEGPGRGPRPTYLGFRAALL